MKPKAICTIAELFADEDEGTPTKLAAFVRGIGPIMGAGVKTTILSREDVRVTIGPEFILKNTTGQVVPSCYSPGSEFSDYSKKLALAWAKCLLEMHKILEMNGDFSIGFCIDEDNAAQCERSNEYGQCYYINPIRVVSQKLKDQCKSFKKAFTGAWQDRFEIISLAAHELVHGLYNLDVHDEEFSSRYTVVNGIMMANLGRLTPLFRL